MKKPKFKIGDTVICIGKDEAEDIQGVGWMKDFVFKIGEIRISYKEDRYVYFPAKGHGVYEEWLMPIGEDGI